jgi:hypothetical protein
LDRFAVTWSEELAMFTEDAAAGAVRSWSRRGKPHPPSAGEVRQIVVELAAGLPGQAQVVNDIRLGINPSYRPTHPFTLAAVKAAGGWQTIRATNEAHLMARLRVAYDATMALWAEHVAADPVAAYEALAALVAEPLSSVRELPAIGPVSTHRYFDSAPRSREPAPLRSHAALQARIAAKHGLTAVAGVPQLGDTDGPSNDDIRRGAQGVITGA